MARPRKSPHLKNQPITISLPPGMIAEIDERLSYKANRSYFIQTCIRDSLDEVSSIPTPSLAMKTIIDVVKNNPNNLNPVLLDEMLEVIMELMVLEDA